MIDRLREAWPRYRRPIRDALVIVGLLRAFVFFVVQGEHPWEFWGVDARAYWGIDLAHPYADSAVGELSNYLYSPVFAQLLAPFSALQFEVFFVLWTTVSVVLLVWLVKPWPWVVPMLLLPIVYELCVGNIHFLLAAAFVVVLRAPAVWAFPLLTKVAPGIGLLWFLFRREWRNLSIAIVATVAVAGLSAALAPALWHDWWELLRRSVMDRQVVEGAYLGITVWLRLPFAVGIIFWGARTDRHWTVPIGVLLAMPILWINVFSLLLAVVPLRQELGLTPARAWLLRERLLPRRARPKPATAPQAG